MTERLRFRPGTIFLFFAIVATLLVSSLRYDANTRSVTTTAAHAQSTAMAATAHAGIDTAGALKTLADDLAGLVTLSDEIKADKVGIVVRSAQSGKLVYSLNPDKPLTPASTTKLVTTFTALSELGPDYQITTDAAVATPMKNGVVTGDLYIRGHGDPHLSVSDVDALIDRITSSGVKQITGDIVGDGSFFDDKFVRTEYSGDADEVEHLPPITALSIERNQFTVIVSSPRTSGQSCNVQTYPRSSGFTIVNSAVSVAPRRAPSRKRRGKKRGDIYEPTPVRFASMNEDDVERVGDEPLLAYNRPAIHKPAPKKAVPITPKKTAATKKTTAQRNLKPTKTKAAVRAATPTRAKASEAARSAAPAEAEATTSVGGLRVRVVGERNGRQTIQVSGGLLANRTVSYRYEMKNPALVVAGIVYDRLRAAGIKIGGSVTSGAAPKEAKPIGEIERPLMEILADVMKHSNNYLAEYVFKIVGAANGGQTETAERSVEVIDQRMNKSQIPFGKCVINDGSGLSRANCLSSEALNGMLRAAYHDPKVFKALYSIMSIAGVDGTLRRRMKGTDAEGNVHGKTGTLRNVSALAGYVTSRDGEMFTFSCLMNGGRHGLYKDVQNKIAQRLAEFSYANETQAEK